MLLRKYKSEDCETLAKLFYDTVHTVNARDYSLDELSAWATGSINLSEWDNTFLENNTIVAEIDGLIIGFGDMDKSGYLDRLYVHKDYQHKKTATAIMNRLEQEAIARGIHRFTTYASITAKGFFEKRGYRLIRANIVTRGKIKLTNYLMQKVFYEQ